jgi:hypothetical protein
VAIPARHVGHIEAAQGFVFENRVLEDLVQRGADVDVAVGEGRAVVEDEFLPAGARLADATVQVGGGPLRQALRFALHEFRLHGEVGAREVDGVLVVHRSKQARRLATGHGCCKR